MVKVADSIVQISRLLFFHFPNDTLSKPAKNYL